MNIKDIIKSQYHAALEMLNQAVAKCPDDMWDDPERKNRFWHIAYHAIFYVHLYLQTAESAFSPWPKHREEYQFMGSLPWDSGKTPAIDKPYTREDILEYIEFVRSQIDATVDSLDLDGPSGFDWLPFNKMEHQFYNIRHLQQHTGELCERLGTEAGIDVDWVGIRREGTA